MIMKKKGLINLILALAFLLTIYFAYFRPSQKQQEMTLTSQSEEDALWMDDVVTKQGATDFVKTIRLDVPLYNQLSEPRLRNGSSVTSLAMLLSYYGYDVDKNQLAEKLPTMPYDTTKANPHQGFVGDIKGSDPSLGVAVEPMAKLAKEIVGEEFNVVTGKDYSFSELLSALENAKPIWLNVTKKMAKLSESDWQKWGTKKNPILVTDKYHAVVLTGMDETFVYYNDPLENKELKIEVKKLDELYNQTKKQFIYIE